jgi:hypothetical protein
MFRLSSIQEVQRNRQAQYLKQLSHLKHVMSRIQDTKKNTKPQPHHKMDVHTIERHNSEKIIEQTVDIINTKYVKPLQKSLQQFQNSVTSPNNVRLDQVVASLDAFKKAMYNVNYLTSLINVNSDEILEAETVDAGKYASVLIPIIEKEYYNNTDDFWIYTMNNKGLNTCYLNWQKYSFWTGLTSEQVVEYNNTHGLQEYNTFGKQAYSKKVKILNELKRKYTDNSILYLLDIQMWDNGLQLCLVEFHKDILRPNKWIEIASGIDLIPFIPNTNDLSQFSPEYLTFINDLSNEITVLNGDDWQVDAIWPYQDPATFDKLNCLYSSQYPEWTGQPISQCFIPGSTIDVPTTIYSIMVDLFFDYPNLKPGQIAIATYNLEDTYYVALLKIDMYEGQLCFKQKSIEINKYFSTIGLNIINDTTINGSLNVKTYDGQNVIKTDNVTKTTAFNTKIGVNQELSKVKGLIDVDNLSNNAILIMMNEFVNPLLYSYDVTTVLKDVIEYRDTSVSIPTTYQDNVFVFKAPIQNVIQSTDISFLYVPTQVDVFANETFDETSFTKIQTIVNELNKMSLEMDLNEETQSFLFSFIELLSDTNNYYLCSLRGIVKRNPLDSTDKEIYFVTSFLNVNDTIINNNYKPYMIKLTDKFSSCCRLLNFSNLLVLDPKIQETLFKGQSISNSTDPYSDFFSDRINNSLYFRERFGGKDLYLFSNEYLTNEELNTIDSTVELLSELLPYHNNKLSTTIFKPNTDTSVFLVTKKRMEQFNNLYGQDKEILSFVNRYEWVKGHKLSFENIFTIQNKKFMIGCGINISDVIDETIIAKGDNKITGNLTILDDVTNVPVFSVNREKKQTSSVFHTGIGNTNPQTMLDVTDCGITDIINVINDMAKRYNLINYNSQNFINALTQSEDDAVQFIENSFIDPTTNKEVVQDINGYLYFNQIPNNLDGQDVKFIYHNLYPNWKNNTLNQLLDNNKNDKQAIQFVINASTIMMKNNNIFNLSNTIDVFQWVAGIKTSLHRSIKANDNFYLIGTGVNLQQYLTYESNDNIQKFFACVESYNFQLQDIVIRKKNIDPSQILNQEKASDVRYQYAQQHPIQSLVQYTIYLNDINKMTISNLDYISLEESNKQVFSSIKDMNLATKLSLFFYNLKIYYTAINEDDYGVLAFEDKYTDFVSLFWCSSSSKSENTITLISLELQINSIVIPSLSLKGDLMVKGDSYFSDGTKNYVFIDTQQQFMGVNSAEILNKYNTSIDNIKYSKLNLSKQNMVVSSNLYPNFVAERIPLGEQFVDDAGNQQPNINSGYFSAVSAMTIRRTSNNYSFQDMFNYSQQYSDPKAGHIKPNPEGVTSMLGKSTKETPICTKYTAGPSFVYEIKDNTGATNILGRNYMGIDKMSSDGITKAGFGIQVNDIDNGSTYRDLLYVDNDSQLSVNSIRLGGHLLTVDEEGNLLFDGKKVSLST